MPGELSNCIAGRIANLFNLHGPNFTVDAACASAMAAMNAAIEGLGAHEFNVAIAGGVDRNMGASTFVKFCAIGALSPTRNAPLRRRRRRLRHGRGRRRSSCSSASPTPSATAIASTPSCAGIGGASDGKGKGITAPNPVGQRLAVERAWRSSGLSPAQCTLVEGHGTSTRVGDVVEVGSLIEAFAGAQLRRARLRSAR